ncbi:hypothetical protein GY14_20785 [Delftia tsuruhatensis]|jgi:hypothetical protein|nr:hypothetical protein GY14_20785 [Delftia tsuruhatensis]
MLCRVHLVAAEKLPSWLTMGASAQPSQEDQMPQPNDFGLDLASRLAMHEMLLQRLFVEYMRRQPNVDDALAQLRQSLMSNFEPDLLNAGKANLSALQTAWVQQQSLHGKELAARFITKVAAGIEQPNE